MIVNHSFPIIYIYIHMYESNIQVNLYDQINHVSTIMKNYVCLHFKELLLNPKSKHLDKWIHKIKLVGN